jgi:hypothetical protein
MANEKKSADQAATAIHDALEKRLLGQPEAAIAKVFVMTLAVASNCPWFLAAEPVVQRVLEKINNKAGKDAVAEIAAEVATEEGYRNIASEVARNGQHEHVLSAVADLFAQQHARGAIGLGQVLELNQSSLEEAVARIALLMSRMEDRLTNPTGVLDPRRPLSATIVLTGPTIAMHATSRLDGTDFPAVRAVTHKRGQVLMLELTNLSKFDVRPTALHVSVVECVDIDIPDLWYFYGMMRSVRKYDVRLQPQVGRYRCTPLEQPEDSYLVLSPGELEVLSVTVTVPDAERLYRVQMSVECSSRGETFVQEFGRVVQFGVYDPEQRVPVRDERGMRGPPPDDGGDTCVKDGMAIGMAIASRATQRQGEPALPT